MSYVNSVMSAVKKDRLEDYKALAGKMQAFFAENGATQYVESIGEGLTQGQVTSFPRAVQAQDDEVVALAFVTYPDRATCDAANEKMRANQGMFGGDMPFDPKRMVFGAFTPIVEWKKGA